MNPPKLLFKITVVKMKGKVVRKGCAQKIHRGY